jgi:hypothetical protein
MWSRPFQFVLFLVVLPGLPALLHAQTPAQDFELARNAFDYQDYKKVISLLDPLLNPEPQLPTKEMVLQAREWLGAANWWNDDKAAFKQQFTRLLQQDSAFKLDSFYYPPDMITEFNALKKQLIDLKIIIVETPPDKAPVTVIIEKTYERPHPIINFIPFGGGQFAGGQTAKGLFFLSAEALMLTANVGSWLYMFNARPGPELRTAATWTMYGSLIAFAGLYTWGVLDSYADFEPRRLIEEKRVENPEESARMFHIVPLAGGNGAFWLGFVTSF